MVTNDQLFRIPHSDERLKDQFILPYLKIEIVYAYIIHALSKKEISLTVGLNYSTVLAVIRSFEQYGRVFKLLSHHSKSFLLK